MISYIQRTIIVLLLLVLSSPLSYAAVPIPSLRPDVSEVLAQRYKDFHRSSHRIQEGDTLLGLLTRAGVNTSEGTRAIEAILPVYDPGRLKVGGIVDVATANVGGERKTDLVGLDILLSPSTKLALSREDDGNFTVKEANLRTTTRYRQGDGVINSSLFAAAQEAAVPDAVMEKFIRLYSYDVDFQRDIHEGDHFNVLYEEIYDTRGRKVATGNIVYAALQLRDDTQEIYRYTTKDGDTDYYNNEGRTIRKSFLRTPVDGARITSGYGQREHPILGYTKMHKGVDFGAPTGTPVYAAADGVIQYLGANGSYGNYVRVQHANGYATAYAHLSGYASKMKNGSRVKQGDVIAYVGTTGRSTGPHLHYEVLSQNTQINPLSMKVFPSRALAGAALNQFKKYQEEVASLVSNKRYADASIPFLEKDEAR